MRRHVRFPRVAVWSWIASVATIVSATANADTAASRPMSPLDRLLLDPAVRRAGMADSPEAIEMAKSLGKDWLNPFARDEDIRADLARLEAYARGQDRDLVEIASDKALSPAEKRARLVRLLGDKIRQCPKCGKRGPLDWAFCPYDGVRMPIAPPPQDSPVSTGRRLLIQEVVEHGTWDDVYASTKLLDLGLQLGLSLEQRMQQQSIPDEMLTDKRGILNRGQVRGITPTFIRWIEEGRRGFVFVRRAYLKEEDRIWLRDKLGVILVATKKRNVIDGVAVAWFCAGLDIEILKDLNSHYGGQGFDTGLQLTDDWQRQSKVDGTVFSAWRRVGKGELIISSLGADINGATPVTIFDDANIELAKNSEAAARVLTWLAGEDR